MTTSQIKITPDTLLHICRQQRADKTTGGTLGRPEYYCTAPMRHIHNVIRERVHDAGLFRIVRELEDGSIMSLLYAGNWCYAITLEPAKKEML